MDHTDDSTRIGLNYRLRLLIESTQTLIAASQALCILAAETIAMNHRVVCESANKRHTRYHPKPKTKIATSAL